MNTVKKAVGLILLFITVGGVSLLSVFHHIPLALQ